MINFHQSGGADVFAVSAVIFGVLFVVPTVFFTQLVSSSFTRDLPLEPSSGTTFKAETKTYPAAIIFFRTLFKAPSPQGYELCLKNGNTFGPMRLFLLGEADFTEVKQNEKHCRDIGSSEFSYQIASAVKRYRELEIGPQDPPVVIVKKDEITQPNKTNSRVYYQPDVYSRWIIFSSIFAIWSAAVLFVAKIASVSISWSRKILRIK